MAEVPTYDPKLAEPDTEFNTVQTSAGPVHFPKTMSPEDQQTAMTQLGVTSAPTYDPKLAEPDNATMTKEAEPGFIAGVAQAGIRGGKESITQQGLREFVTPKGGYGPVGTAVRETALAPLEALGTVTAPAAVLGGMAGEAVKRGVQAITPESLSPENDPTGSQAAILQHIPGAVGAMIDFGTNMMLPSAWATGGVNRLLHGWSASRYANELGGPKAIINQGAQELTGMANTPRGIEEAGQKLAASQYEASQSARAAHTKMLNDAISSVPTTATTPTSLVSEIQNILPNIGALSTSTQRRLDRVAAELENPTQARVASKLPMTWRTSNIVGADPDFTAKILRAMGVTTGQRGPKRVTFAQSIARRQALSALYGNTTNDADRRLYKLVLSAADKDIASFSKRYPQAVALYEQTKSKYAGQVAQYHAEEAPLRNLVDKTAPSEMMTKLRKLDVESIRNIKNGIVAGPNGLPAMEQIKSGVVQSLVESAVNPTTGGFNSGKFLKQFDDMDNVRKLREILGDKFQHLAVFRDALSRAGMEKFPENSGIVKMMGVYQGVTAAEQSLRMVPTMWYHLLRLGSIVMAPKLFGKFLENGRGAKLLAAGILAKPGSPQAGSIAAALETMAKGLGAQQLRALPAATGAVATELPNQPKQVAQP